MGSINKRPLKAFVRFDGSGRVVAGSLVLRRKKPKVGNWKEITAYECCNPTTTTTTTAPVVVDCYSGNVTGIIYYYTGTSYTQFDDLVVTTLRSRDAKTNLYYFTCCISPA